jgi:hypothetical protein
MAFNAWLGHVVLLAAKVTDNTDCGLGRHVHYYNVSTANSS